MRKVLFAIVLACSLLPMVQCSSDETISGFDGKLVTIASPYIKTVYKFPVYRYSIQTDSIKWLYDFEPGKESRVRIIAAGKFQMDSIISFTGDDAATAIINEDTALSIDLTNLYFGIETYFDSSPSTIQVKINPDGTFLDTIPVSSSPMSELVLTQSSRLFAWMKTYNDTIVGTNDSISIINHDINDTIALPNPRGLQK